MSGSREPDGAPPARPPVPSWAPLAWFGVLAAVLVLVVVTTVRPPGPLDAPDPAQQRDGVLRDGPRLAPRVVGIAFGGRPTVLLFLRRLPDTAALRRWALEVPRGTAVHVVLPSAPRRPLPVPAAVDPSDRLSQAVGMPTPLDGGRPVGYAVVDRDRRVRYATLDPEYLQNAFEVAVVVGAVA